MMMTTTRVQREKFEGEKLDHENPGAGAFAGSNRVSAV